MSFISIQFITFLSIVFTLYFILPKKYKNSFLLFSSYIFYGFFDLRFVPILFLYTIVAFFSGIAISKNNDQKKLILISSTVFYIGGLLGFKYYDFITSIIANILIIFNIEMNQSLNTIILPIGISFYTFQSISYIVDVYRGSIRSEQNFVDLSLFIAFFPQITSGPISRAKNLLPKLKQNVVFNYALAEAGLYQVVWGIFKKVVIADQLSVVVKFVFDNYAELNGIQILIGIFSYSIQVYTDFSGYSDIAIGVSKILGIDLGINFKNPYFARTIKDFWSRWHISLSTWFRDYLYFPLGGNRVVYPRWVINTLITFLVSGLWHGANITFIIWGVLHGLFQIVQNVIGKIFEKFEIKHKMPSWFLILMNFVLVSIAWIFFRADTVPQAFAIISRAIIIDIPQDITVLFDLFLTIGLDRFILVIQALSLMMLFYVEYNQYKERRVFYDYQENRSRLSYFAIFLIVWILVFGSFGSTDFIYFNF